MYENTEHIFCLVLFEKGQGKRWSYALVSKNYREWKTCRFSNQAMARPRKMGSKIAKYVGAHSGR